MDSLPFPLHYRTDTGCPRGTDIQEQRRVQCHVRDLRCGERDELGGRCHVLDWRVVQPLRRSVRISSHETHSR